MDTDGSNQKEHGCVNLITQVTVNQEIEEKESCSKSQHFEIKTILMFCRYKGNI